MSLYKCPIKVEIDKYEPVCERDRLCSHVNRFLPSALSQIIALYTREAYCIVCKKEYERDDMSNKMEFVCHDCWNYTGLCQICLGDLSSQTTSVTCAGCNRYMHANVPC